MKFRELPKDPTNADIVALLGDLHDCVEDGKRADARRHRAVMKAILKVEGESIGRDQVLDAAIKALDDKTQKTFKSNADAFALWLEGDNNQNAKVTKLIEALGADKPEHHSLISMSQGQALWTVIAAIAATVLAAPLAVKVVAAVWAAAGAVLLAAGGH